MLFTFTVTTKTPFPGNQYFFRQDLTSERDAENVSNCIKTVYSKLFGEDRKPEVTIEHQRQSPANSQ